MYRRVRVLEDIPRPFLAREFPSAGLNIGDTFFDIWQWLFSLHLFNEREPTIPFRQVFS
jgi:hypothetical protein